MRSTTTLGRTAAFLALLTALAACGGGESSVAGAGAPGANERTGDDGTGDDGTSDDGSGDDEGPDDGDDQEGQDARAEPEVAGVIARDLQAPWGIAFLPDGTALVSLRDSGTIVAVDPDADPDADGNIREVGAVPGVAGGGSGGFLWLTPTEGGLLGLAASPDFAEDRLVYAYLTSAGENRVLRMTYDGTSLGEAEVVLDGIEASNIHNGGRIAFGPDGFLYVSTGDASQPALAQDLGSLNGKILRITPDGQPAPGNPFEESPVWSYGHRNVQGLGWDDDGRMYASEFGQDTFDELNLIRPGGNYGWPVVEGIGEGDGAEYVDPLVVWTPAEASPSGITVRGGAVYVAGLRGARLWQVPVADIRATGEVGEPRAYFAGDYGRLRSVETAPDGSMWLMTNNTDSRGDPKPGDDRILRVTFD
jgi:glucose/arabinose dehydrogenase